MKVVIRTDGTVAGTSLVATMEGSEKWNALRGELGDFDAVIDGGETWPDLTVNLYLGELMPLNSVGIRVEKGVETEFALEYKAWGEGGEDDNSNGN